MTNDSNNCASFVALLVGVLDLSQAEAVALADEGHRTVEEIAYAPLDELLLTKRIEEGRMVEIRARARRIMGVRKA